MAPMSHADASPKRSFAIHGTGECAKPFGLPLPSPSPINTRAWHEVGQRMASVFVDMDGGESPSATPQSTNARAWYGVGQRMASVFVDINGGESPSATPKSTQLTWGCP